MKLQVIFWIFVCSCAVSKKQTSPPEYNFETIAGSIEGHLDGESKKSLFRTPEGIAIDSRGNLFITDYWASNIRKISFNGEVSVLAGKDMDTGNINGTGNNARFNRPHGLVAVGDSVIYVCDMKSHTIRSVSYNGDVSTYAGIMGEGGATDGFRTNARFNMPEAIAVNSKGELFVADSYNFTIRKIALNGEVTTFAGVAGKGGYSDGSGTEALFNKPLGIAIDGKDNIYVADSDYDGKDNGNCLIRKISPNGKVTTLAGIPLKSGHVDAQAKNAQFNRPVGITVTADGIIFIADTEADLIRKINKNGKVSTIGGTYLDESFADGIGANARFADPQGIVVDLKGNLYISDTFNNRIRKGTIISGTTGLKN
jgi:sugar lactone lactonase YvrE